VSLKSSAVLALLVALSSAALQAQSAVVYGTVTSAQGSPLPNANVELVGTPLGSVTDRAGNYRMSGAPTGRVVVSARFIGYLRAFDTVTVVADDSVRADFVLPASVTQVDDVVVTLPPTIVTAAKRSQLLDQAVTSVAVVSDTDLARRAVNTVDEAVDKAPGVQFLNGQVNIRGSTGYVQGLGSRVLLLVDGVPANQGDRAGINWDLVPLAEVARVEVVKGAGSSLYGSSAFGGVVNVITRDLAAGWHARVRASGGAYANPPHAVWRFRDYTGGHEGLDVTGSYGTDRVRGGLTAGGWHSDGYREQDRQTHWQGSAKGVWLPRRATRVTASGSWASDQSETPLIWCSSGGCDDRGQAYQPFMIDTTGRGRFTRSDKGYVTALLERTASERLAWQARASWLRTSFTDLHQGADDFGVANRLGAELRGTTRPAAGRVVTVGAEVARSDVRTNIFTGDTSTTSGVIRTHTQGEFAAYGESEQLFGRARITAGARVDYSAVDGGGLSAVVSPRLGGVLATSRGAWRASVGRGFRAPSLAERFVSTTVAPFRVIPNPSLRPETAWSVELGNATRVSAALHSDVAVFWTEAYDLIEPGVNGSSIQFRNLTRARLAGLDVALTAQPPVPRLTMALAYTFLYARALARDSVPGAPLAFRPKHLLTLSADYRWRAVSVGGDFRYASRFERVELYPDDARLAGKVLDLRAAVEQGPLSVRCRLANALNYIYSQVPRTLAPVRTLSVTLTWTY